MKIKYNFGLLKQMDIGFSSENHQEKFHAILLDVKKIGNKYRFVFESNHIEIDEFQFSNCKIERIDDVYWFVCQSTPTCSGLFLFTMFDTYGFPLEISEEECLMNGVKPDREGFLLMRELQKNKSKNTFNHQNAFG